MTDNNTTIQQLRAMVAQFVQERDWQQFHNLKNLSMNIATESAELMELFLWVETAESLKEMERNRQEVEDELADIFMAVFSFANAANIDLTEALVRKLQKAAEKYPVEKSKGKSTKYTKL